jgi:hypothetical protein
VKPKLESQTISAKTKAIEMNPTLVCTPGGQNRKECQMRTVGDEFSCTNARSNLDSTATLRPYPSYGVLGKGKLRSVLSQRRTEPQPAIREFSASQTRRRLSFSGLLFHRIDCGEFSVPMRLGARSTVIQFARFLDRCATSRARHRCHLSQG